MITDLLFILIIFFIFLSIAGFAFWVGGKGYFGLVFFFLAGLDGIFLATQAFTETGNNFAVGILGLGMAIFMFLIGITMEFE